MTTLSAMVVAILRVVTSPRVVTNLRALINPRAAVAAILPATRPFYHVMVYRVLKLY